MSSIEGDGARQRGLRNAFGGLGHPAIPTPSRLSQGSLSRTTKYDIPVDQRRHRHLLAPPEHAGGVDDGLNGGAPDHIGRATASPISSGTSVLRDSRQGGILPSEKLRHGFTDLLAELASYYDDSSTRLLSRRPTAPERQHRTSANGPAKSRHICISASAAPSPGIRPSPPRQTHR